MIAACSFRKENQRVTPRKRGHRRFEPIASSVLAMALYQHGVKNALCQIAAQRRFLPVIGSRHRMHALAEQFWQTRPDNQPIKVATVIGKIEGWRMVIRRL